MEQGEFLMAGKRLLSLEASKLMILEFVEDLKQRNHNEKEA